MQKLDKAKALYLTFASLLVVGVIVWHLGVRGGHVEPVASDACIACHLDAQIITGLYIPPETVGGGGG